MCGTTPGPRYVYYKLYTKDGALETNRPIYSNDRFISRVLSRSVAPPHTAGSLKLRLRKIEGFEEGDLYLSISEKSHVEDSTRLSLRRQVGPGLSKDDPVALVVSDPEKRFGVSSTGEEKLVELLTKGQNVTSTIVYTTKVDRPSQIPLSMKTTHLWVAWRSSLLHPLKRLLL